MSLGIGRVSRAPWVGVALVGVVALGQWAGGSGAAAASLGGARAGRAARRVSPPSVVLLTSGAMPIKVDGRRWSLGLSFGRFSGGFSGGSGGSFGGSFFGASRQSFSGDRRTNASGQLQVTLSRLAHGVGEFHDWAFSVSRRAISLAGGSATLDTSSKLSPVLALDVRFVKASSRKLDCRRGSETIFTGRLTGKLVLRTGLARARTIGGADVVFKGSNRLVIDHSCARPPTTPPCLPTIWEGPVPPPGNVFVSGLGGQFLGRRRSVTSVTKMTALARPAHATRSDGAAAFSPAPVFDSRTHTLSVKGSTSGAVTGTATLVGSQPHVSSNRCTSGGTVHRETIAFYNATFTSQPGNRFKARTLLTGTLTAPASGSGFFESAKRS